MNKTGSTIEGTHSATTDVDDLNAWTQYDNESSNKLTFGVPVNTRRIYILKKITPKKKFPPEGALERAFSEKKLAININRYIRDIVQL